MNLVWGGLYVLFWGLSLALGGLPWSAAGARAGALANPHIWALLLSCLALEVLTPSHDATEEPGGFSSSAALLIAAAQRGWASAASLLCLVCLVLGGHPKEFKHRLLRLCPVQGALLLQAALHHLNAGPANYLAAGLWFLWSLAQSRPQGDKWTHQLYSHFGVAALAVFLGSTQDLWQQSQYLATLPLLLLAQQGPTSTTPERKGATQPLAPPSSEEMSLIQEQHDLMESFGQTLANLPGLTERAEFIVSTVQKLIPSRTVCLFLRSDSGQLEPRAFATEGSVADIAQGWHDIIADVWETGKDYCGPVYTSRRKQVASEAASSPAQLFTSSRGETFAAVFSVGPGVLFAGRELAHSPREADLLRFVVEKAKLALRLSWEGAAAWRARRSRPRRS